MIMTINCDDDNVADINVMHDDVLQRVKFYLLVIYYHTSMLTYR